MAAIAGLAFSAVLFCLCSVHSAQFSQLDDVVLQQELNRLSLADMLSGNGFEDQVPIQRSTAFAVDQEVRQLYGQVSGIAISSSNELILFSRRDRVWRFDTFDEGNRFTYRDKGFIENDTIAVIDQVSGKILRSFGGKRFFMPHGISVDPDGNVWVTDVALHQVMRFPRSDVSAPDLVLGEAFVPGNDQFHFCKPTDIAVSSTGVAYISDGYCNSRIVIVSPEGKVVGSIGNGDLNVAHSIVLFEKDDMVCVADREGRRVACYTAGLKGSQAGKLLLDLRHPALKRVYAIDRMGDILFAVNGPESQMDRPVVVAIDLPSERLIAQFAPSEPFFEPHDITIAADGNSFFVADVDQRSIRKVHQFSLTD